MSRALTRYTWKPASASTSYSAIQYTPVDCITTVAMPCCCKNRASSRRSAVKHLNLRTGSRAFLRRNGHDNARYCLTSMQAALGCTASRPGFSVHIFRCCSLLCFRFGFPGFASVVALFSAAMWGSPVHSLGCAARPGGESKITLSNGVKPLFFQDRLPPNERSPDTGAILSIGHASTIGSSALAAAPLLIASHHHEPSVSVTNDAGRMASDTVKEYVAPKGFWNPRLRNELITSGA